MKAVATPWSKSWRGQKRRVGGFCPPQSKSWGGRLIGERSEPKFFLDVPPFFCVSPPFWGGHTEKLGGTSKKCFRILYTINYLCLSTQHGETDTKVRNISVFPTKTVDDLATYIQSCSSDATIWYPRRTIMNWIS